MRRARRGRGLYTRLGRPVGDALVTAGDVAVLRRVVARAYGGDTADGPLVRGARAYGGADAKAPRDGAHRGARASGRSTAQTPRLRAARARLPGQGRRRAATAARGRA